MHQQIIMLFKHGLRNLESIHREKSSCSENLSGSNRIAVINVPISQRSVWLQDVSMISRMVMKESIALSLSVRVMFCRNLSNFDTFDVSTDLGCSNTYRLILWLWLQPPLWFCDVPNDRRTLPCPEVLGVGFHKYP